MADKLYDLDYSPPGWKYFLKEFVERGEVS
jgi:hypothetical protein